MLLRNVPHHPEKLIPKLVALDQALEELPSSAEPYRTRKRQRVRGLIAASAGLWLDAHAERAQVTLGSQLTVTLSALTRLPTELKLKGVRVDHSGVSIPASDLISGEYV